MTRNNFLKRLGLMAIAAVVAPFVPKPEYGARVVRKTHRVSSREPTTETVEFAFQPPLVTTGPQYGQSFTVKDAIREHQEGHLYLDCDTGKWYLLGNGKWKAI